VSWLLVGLLCPGLLADEPPSPLPDGSTTLSRAGTSFCRVDRRGLEPGSFRISVYRTAESDLERVRTMLVAERDEHLRSLALIWRRRLPPTLDGTLLWSVVMSEAGYQPTLYLSDCGKYLVCLRDWAVNSHALEFYASGVRVAAYEEKDLDYNRAMAIRTISHRSWVLASGLFFFSPERFQRRYDHQVVAGMRLHGIDQAAATFFVTSVDGVRHVFDLETGRKVSSTPWVDTPGFVAQYEEARHPQWRPMEPAEKRLRLLTDALTSDDPDEQRSGLVGLGAVGGREYLPVIREWLQHENESSRICALIALKDVGEPVASEELRRVAEDPTQMARIRRLAAEFLEDLQAGDER
jgi:hypothetical protein